jgi:hypothetical protein
MNLLTFLDSCFISSSLVEEMPADKESSECTDNSAVHRLSFHLRTWTMSVSSLSIHCSILARQLTEVQADKFSESNQLDTKRQDFYA